MVDGRSFIQERYRETLAAIKITAKAYQSYFQSRYQADTNRALSINYFSCGANACPSANLPLWDMDGYIPLMPANKQITQAIYTSLGLSKSDVTDGYGNLIYMQNSGDGTRNTNNSNASMRQPPFTALIYANISGTQVSQTIVGTP